MSVSDAYIAASAEVHGRATVGVGSRIWHLAQVREHAVLGDNCVIGRGAYIGKGVILGDDCKVQNYALIYEPASLADGVFVGPAAVLTNDRYPRAINPDSSQKSSQDWNLQGVTIGRGASVGAGAICIAPVTIGAWATVAAGAVVTDDVHDFALVVGVPAKQIGWVGKAGVPLEPGDGPWEWVCPARGDRYIEAAGRLRPAEV